MLSTGVHLQEALTLAEEMLPGFYASGLHL